MVLMPESLSADSQRRELDAVDHRLIDELKKDGRQGLAKIGEVVGLTGDSVKDRLSKLTNDGVIKVTCSVDPHVLGFKSITLLGIKVVGKAEEIASELVSVPEFDFVCCVAGEYDILVEAVCRDDLHLLKVVDEFLRARKDVASVSSHNYLAVLKFEPAGNSLSTAAAGADVPELDEIDLKIIKALQEDGRATFQEIAELIGMPYQTTRRRAKALLESKTVQPETLVNRLVEGTAVVAAVNLRTSGPIAPIAEQLLLLPEVEIAVFTTGAYDLMLEVACRDRDHLAKLVGDLIPSVRGVLSTETSIYQRVLKLPQSWSGLVRKM